MVKTLPEVMTLNEAAAYLRIPKSTMYKLCREGRIPAQKIGRQWRFHRQAIKAWLKVRDGEARD